MDISGPRLTLRELRADDVDGVLTVYGNPVATEHLSFEPRSREQVEAIVDRSMTSAGADPRTEYALAVDLDGRLVGFARLALDPHSPRGATVGFALHPDVWGRGLGVETVHLLCELGFRRLELHRLWGARAPRNEASARTLLRAGFTEEGRLREHVYVRGAWRDSITCSILDHEWRPPPA